MQNLRIILLFFSLLFSTHILAHQLEGRICFGDSLPAPHVTVYVPATGQGTISTIEGYYHLDNLNGDSIEVQYSLVGYKTINKKIGLKASELTSLDIYMQEQAILLNNVYVTPDGLDPAVYILNQVSQQAQKNRQRLIAYTANMEATMHAQDMDFIPMLLPKTVLWILKRFIRMAHAGATFEYCVSAPTIDITLQTAQQWKKGKVKFFGDKIVRATPTPSNDATDQMFRFSHINLFDMLYGDKTQWGKKRLKDNHFELKGTFEENGMTIDVLECFEGYIIKENKTISLTTTLYVIEDVWGILRIESNTGGTISVGSDGGEKSIIECRNIGGNIYLPISKVSEPSPIEINEGLEEAIREFKNDPENSSRMERQIFERAEKMLKSGRKLSPYMSTGYVIKYSEIEVK